MIKIKDNNWKTDHSRLLPDICQQQNTIHGQEDIQGNPIFTTRSYQDPPAGHTTHIVFQKKKDDGKVYSQLTSIFSLAPLNT